MGRHRKPNGKSRSITDAHWYAQQNLRTHTFFGTERNNVEKNIISATQWEAGATNSSKITRGFSNTFAR